MNTRDQCVSQLEWLYFSIRVSAMDDDHKKARREQIRIFSEYQFSEWKVITEQRAREFSRFVDKQKWFIERWSENHHIRDCRICRNREVKGGTQS